MFQRVTAFNCLLGKDKVKLVAKKLVRFFKSENNKTKVFLSTYTLAPKNIWNHEVNDKMLKRLHICGSVQKSQVRERKIQ